MKKKLILSDISNKVDQTPRVELDVGLDKSIYYIPSWNEETEEGEE